MGQRLIHLTVLIGALALAPFAVAAAVVLARSDSTIQLIAMDADPAGNTATSLGHLDPCVRAEPGNEVTVDLVADAVPEDRPFIGYQIDVKYDSSLLELSGVDNDFLLGANGDFQPYDGLSDPLPDSDGSFTIAIADLASNVTSGANMETGEGVLSRLTFKAKSAGLSAVAPGYSVPESYPALIDLYNETMEVRSIAGIKIAVGENCPAGLTEIQPTPLPPLASLEGTPTPAPTPVSTQTSSPAPVVAPVALPATGGAVSGASSEFTWIVAVLAAATSTCAALWIARRLRG